MARIDELHCCGLGQLCAGNEDTIDEIHTAIEEDIDSTEESVDCDDDCPEEDIVCRECPNFVQIDPKENGRRRAYFCITRDHEIQLSKRLKKIGFKKIVVFPRRICCGEGNLTMWLISYPIKKQFKKN